MVLPQNQDETMMSKVEAKLNEMGVTIPDAPTPAANYLPFTQSGNLVFVSGQVPFVDGKLAIDKWHLTRHKYQITRLCEWQIICRWSWCVGNSHSHFIQFCFDFAHHCLVLVLRQNHMLCRRCLVTGLSRKISHSCARFFEINQ